MTTPRFEKSVERLSVVNRRKLKKALTLLAIDPYHSQLKPKKVKAAVSKGVYEYRVARGLRLIGQKIGENRLKLLYIGQHDTALRFGERWVDRNAA